MNVIIGVIRDAGAIGLVVSRVAVVTTSVNGMLRTATIARVLSPLTLMANTVLVNRHAFPVTLTVLRASLVSNTIEVERLTLTVETRGRRITLVLETVYGGPGSLSCGGFFCGHLLYRRKGL